MLQDIFIGIEMKKYISNYRIDKSDLLIFLQSDYFKMKLPGRIICNLDTLVSSLWFKKKFKSIIQDKEVELSENDQNYMKKIIDFRKKWISLFDTHNPSDPLSISKLIDNMPIETNQSTSGQQNPNDQPSNNFVKVNNGTNNSNNYNNTKGESQNPSQKSIFDITVNSVEVDDTNNKDINETKEKLNVQNDENKPVDLLKQLPVDQDTNSRRQKMLRICTYISIGVIAFGILVGFIFYIFSK
jgi:hypothetical protein